MAKIKYYRDNLPRLFDQLKADIDAQLESLYQLMNEVSLEIELNIQRNLSSCRTGIFAAEEPPHVTGDLKFDIDTSLDPVIDEFMTKL